MSLPNLRRTTARTRILPIALLAASQAVAPAAAQQPAAPVELAITNASVIDVRSGAVRADQTLLVGDGRILQVGPAAELVVPAGAQRVDATGLYVIPGLWDAHVHSAASVDWHFPLFLAHGITSVRNMHTTVDTPLALTNAIKRSLAAGTLRGPRFLANGGIVDGRPAVWPGAVEVETAAQARSAVDSLAAGGADFIKVYDNLSAETFFTIMEQARLRGIPVDGHMPIAVPATEGAAAGLRTVEHGSGILMGCSARADSIRAVHARNRQMPDLPDPEAAFLGLLAAARRTYDPSVCQTTVRAYLEHGVAVTPTLVQFQAAAVLLEDTTGLGSMIPPAVVKRWAAMAASGPGPFGQAMAAGDARRNANLRMLHEAGVPLLAGTDLGNPFLVPGRSLHRELELLVHDGGLSPLDALRAATINPARAFGMADSLGTIAAGMVADLVLLDANPLEDIRNTQTIRGVVLHGRYLGQQDPTAR